MIETKIPLFLLHVKVKAQKHKLLVKAFQRINYKQKKPTHKNQTKTNNNKKRPTAIISNK